MLEHSDNVSLASSVDIARRLLLQISASPFLSFAIVASHRASAREADLFPELALLLPEGALKRVLAALHREMFYEWLKLPLEQQRVAVEFYFNSKHTSTEGTLLATPSRAYAPETAERPERQLFDADVSIVLAMIQAQHDSQRANNPGLWRLVVAIQIVKAQTNGHKLTLSELSKQLGISPTNLGRIFQQWTGLTCRGYMLCARMVTAAYVMQTTDKSVEEIVGTLGYRDESGFDRDFYRAFGKSPASQTPPAERVA